MDPLHQFEVKTFIPLKLGTFDFSLTNSSISIIFSTLMCIGLTHLATRKKSQIPTLSQSFIEYVFSFFKDIVRSHLGEKASSYFPFIFSLFLFISLSNLMGLFPGMFTITAQLVVTMSLALIVFFLATGVGLFKHGFKFFNLFIPKGVPIYITPFLILIEIISYCFRPISLGVRLFANMVAGHIMVEIFGGFSVLLSKLKFLSVLAAIPLLVNVCLMGFECLVAVLQAYVFTLLTCIYVHDGLYLH